jgi:hypothetical protein
MLAARPLPVPHGTIPNLYLCRHRASTRALTTSWNTPSPATTTMPVTSSSDDAARQISCAWPRWRVTTTSHSTPACSSMGTTVWRASISARPFPLIGLTRTKYRSLRGGAAVAELRASCRMARTKAWICPKSSTGASTNARWAAIRGHGAAPAFVLVLSLGSRSRVRSGTRGQGLDLSPIFWSTDSSFETLG